MRKIKQFLCPILGTWYLVGGYEYGHQWRYVEGQDKIICRKCGKAIFFLTYKEDEKAGKELLEKIGGRNEI